MAFRAVLWTFVSIILLVDGSDILSDLKNGGLGVITNKIPAELMNTYNNMTCPLLLMVKQYTEMSCSVTDLRNATFIYCPKGYDCSAAEQFPEYSCTYKGKSYAVGSKISKKAMKVRCKSNCVCQLNDVGVAGFSCKTEKCSEPKPGCRLIYSSHSDCCPTEKCKPMKKKEKNCKLLEKWYSFGEILCNNCNNTRCLCQKGYDGTTRGKWCKQVECGIELDYQNTAKQGCSPVYEVNMTSVNELANNMMSNWTIDHLPTPKLLQEVIDRMTSAIQDICPLSWVCPSDNDVLVPALSLLSDLPDLDPDTRCSFGYNDLTILDALLTPEREDGSCAMCTCLMPPMLSCVHKKPCWTF